MKIPIGNVYFLLCYAWGHAQHSRIVDSQSLGSVDRVQDLLGMVLSRGCFDLIRRGIDRGYLEQREDLPGPRGKIDPSESAKRAVRAKGRVSCVFDRLDVDVLQNRIIKSTLRDLLRIRELDDGVRDEVRSAHQRLADVSWVEVSRDVFRRVQVSGNRSHYRFLMSVCELVYECLIPDAKGDSVRFRDFRDDEAKMWKLFEDFVREFFRKEQATYRVNHKGRLINWSSVSGASEVDLGLVPRMEADVILEGASRRIIIDAKFHEGALKSHHGSRKLNSGNLYQILAYLRNREMNMPNGPRHEGILLYPVVDEAISVDVWLEGFRVQARGVDLAKPWGSIHSEMLALI